MPEAYLVVGYCQFIKKNYQDAIEALIQTEKLTEQPFVTVAARDSARLAYDAMQNQLDSVQVFALDLANQLPTPRVESKRKAFRSTFDKVYKVIEDYATFMQRVIQSDRFESNRKRILEDAFPTKPLYNPPLPNYNKPSKPNYDSSISLEDDL